MYSGQTPPGLQYIIFSYNKNVLDPLTANSVFFDKTVMSLEICFHSLGAFSGPCLFGLYPNGLFMFGLFWTTRTFGLPMAFGLTPRVQTVVVQTS